MAVFMLLASLVAIVQGSVGARSLNYVARPLLLVFLLFFWMFLSSFVVSSDIFRSVYATINWFFGAPLFFIYFSIFYNDRAVCSLIKTLFVVMIFCNIIGIVESALQKSLFEGFLISETEYAKFAAQDKFRGDQYRVKSVFSNPLVYAQFLLISIAVSFYYLRKERGLLRIFSIANIIISYLMLLGTDSRAGLAVAIAYPVLISYMRLQKGGRVAAVISRKLLSALAILTLAFIVYQISEAAVNLKDIQELIIEDGASQESISSLVRVLQLRMGYDALLQSPVFGYGMGMSLVAMEPLKALDNYYLTTILSVGIFGLLILFWFFFYIYKAAVIKLKRDEDGAYSVLAGCVFVIMVYYLILSIDHADPLLYSLCSMLYISRR